ncbi:MAG: hypothetical protein JXR94_07820 [Candidatus Hydrogenedentes bacterium]|nr:hypothetical protein [Candidatus Hydrogenedentota bacterium]
MNRRQFLGTAGALGGLAAMQGCAGVSGVGGGRRRGAAGRRAPYKLLFNNDSTNVLSCESPYHKRGEPFRPEMLEGTVDEVAGADVHLLMPGMGWVPWWQSEVLPMAKHQEWFRKHYGVEPANSYHDYVLAGGDMVKVFVDRCRARGQAPFITFRLNDGHHLEFVDEPKPFNVQSLCQFYVEHPEYRIGPDKRDWCQHVQNWAIPEVRDYKFAFIQELCEDYDLDGFELDFMRHCSYFNLEETTAEERAAVMVGFVGRVRALLDRTAKPGQHRWLSARIPCWMEALEPLGLDLPAMVDAGLEMVNVSPYYFTRQYHDLAGIRALVPEASLYLEMTQAACVGPTVGKGYDNFSFRRSADPMLYTTAHLAYEAGADGISLFNFVYYREHGTPNRGPFNEPPFYTFPHLKEPGWLAKQPQWYYLGHDWQSPRQSRRQLEKVLKPGAAHTFTMHCAPDAGLDDGVFRLFTLEPSSECRWRVSVNGVELAPTDFVMKPIDHPYDGGIGKPDQYACFACPRAAVQPGDNAIRIELEQGAPASIEYIDLVLPRKA